MKKNFLKSITTGIVGLTLLSGCSHFAKKSDSNACNANGCPAKKEKSSTKGKKGTNGCATKKEKNSSNVNKNNSSSKEATPTTK